MRIFSKGKLAICMLILLLAIGFMVPERKVIPVQGATSADWNKRTFWFAPWGASGVHKGIDIFAKMNTPVIASTNMLVVYTGNIKRGGNIVIALGPKWRLHYFAHLNKPITQVGDILATGEVLGYLGDTGNAKGKPSHLHYSIFSLIPYIGRIDFSQQGYKKAFYLDPGDYLTG